ncbi:molybdopterin-dependent oxidoreductase (plasmid) [Rhizobium sp. WSM4643]|uniref:molybdopterin-dependent oxidoreductase n=1 Tax=Rhizobium sp. WSM4643 TaxID=3138253 RepID=UPI0021A3CE3F|nr:molybdopterin-dependent oxidoreductase [Rhizobium leguminosarum]UWM78163.1 molybdopterin-dependent oxidoreductase [Rhizobium leguminosarum bv. viciae]
MPTPEQPSLIVRQKSPQNNEFPFASLSDWLIPTELFFVRNHFPSPHLDARDWRLRVGGAVERPIELDLDSIKAMRSTTFTAVVEYAGNGRVYYEPPKEGLQWQNGAVGNAASCPLCSNSDGWLDDHYGAQTGSTDAVIGSKHSRFVIDHVATKGSGIVGCGALQMNNPSRLGSRQLPAYRFLLRHSRDMIPVLALSAVGSAHGDLSHERSGRPFCLPATGG